MKKVILNVLTIVLIVATFAACGGGNGSSYKIKMTTEINGEVGFYLGGSGIATVDWGDGSEKVSLTLNEDGLSLYRSGESLYTFDRPLYAQVAPTGVQDGVLNYYGVRFVHTYSNATIRTITINGDNITALFCIGGYPWTSLDVSKNTALKFLICERTQLKNLDVSKNTALTYLSVNANPQLTGLDVSKNTALTSFNVTNSEFTSTTLNTLFGTLPNTTIQGETKTIYVQGNPGAYDCNKSIAERKGWTVKNLWSWQEN